MNIVTSDQKKFRIPSPVVISSEFWKTVFETMMSDKKEDVHVSESSNFMDLIKCVHWEGNTASKLQTCSNQELQSVVMYAKKTCVNDLYNSAIDTLVTRIVLEQ